MRYKFFDKKMKKRSTKSPLISIEAYVMSISPIYKRTKPIRVITEGATLFHEWTTLIKLTKFSQKLSSFIVPLHYFRLFFAFPKIMAKVEKTYHHITQMNLKKATLHLIDAARATFAIISFFIISIVSLSQTAFMYTAYKLSSLPKIGYRSIKIFQKEKETQARVHALISPLLKLALVALSIVSCFYLSFTIIIAGELFIRSVVWVIKAKKALY